MKIVIDSNVFISGIFWKGASNEIIRLAEEEKVEISATSEIINEGGDSSWAKILICHPEFISGSFVCYAR